MSNAEQILVVILASFLALGLLLSIFALVKIVQILNAIKRITAKAESVADKAESVSGFFAKTAAPAAIGRLLLNLASTVWQKKGKSKRRDEDE